MSIESELKKEHKKLTQEREQIERLLIAIERMMKEYNISFFPSTKTLEDMIEVFIVSKGGRASYGEIHDYLRKQNIDMPKAKFSQILTHHPRIKYNGKEWGIIQQSGNDNHQLEPLDLDSHLNQRETKIS